MAVCRGKALSARDISLNYQRPDDFVSCSVRRSPLLYAILVTCLSVYSVTMSVYTGLTSDYGVKIFIWLTYWSYFALTGRFILSTVNAWRYVVKQKLWSAGERCAGTTRDDKTAASSDCRDETPTTQDMPVLYKIQWVLQNISGASAILVTALYWTIMFDHSKVETIRSINSHIVNAVIALTDICVSRAPVRIHHCLHCLVFVTAYILFTAFYWAAGGLNHQGEDYIYPLLNYSRSPGRAVLVYLGVALLATPCLQLILYTVYRLREACLARCPDRITTQCVVKENMSTTQCFVTENMSSTVKSSFPSVVTDGSSISSDLKDIGRSSTMGDMHYKQDIQMKVLMRPLLKPKTSQI